MGKHSKKRQRTAQKEVSERTPLGYASALNDQGSKDDEEKRLEALLFGTSFPTLSTTTGDLHKNAVPNDPGFDTGGELENLMDSDLFYIDTAGPSTLADDLLTSNHTTDFDGDEHAADALKKSEQGGYKPRDDSRATAATLLTSYRKKNAAWADPDDVDIEVSLASDNRLRKLRDTPSEDIVKGRDYEARLRRQYEKVNPAPEWASAARDLLHRKRRRRASQSSESANASDDEDHITPLITSSGRLLSSQKSLPQGQISIERLRDANQSAKAEGEIRSVKFHPSPSVSVLLTASADRRLRLFNIDGHTNPHLQSVHIPTLPIISAQFHPSGASVLLTGHRPFYYTYDLQSGTCTRSPRGLWGTHSTNPDDSDLSMEICTFSQTGDMLAVAGRRGYVHLVDWRRGGGQVVGSVKMNAGVKDVWWTAENRLMSLGEDAEVYMWDMDNRRCLRRWKDDGGFGSVMMTGSRNNSYLAIGSKTGLVNVYGSDSTMVGAQGVPKPLKTIGNLTTTISTMCFNRDAQILALSSKTKKDQLKLVHLPSLTVFANWPTSATPLGHTTSMDFSPGTEYAAIGNTRGRVLLYNLRHFVSN